MIKTILILSSLLAGVTSFASQSTQTNQGTKTSQVPFNCTITIRLQNVQITTTSANCVTTFSAAQTQSQYINLDASLMEGDPVMPEGNLSIPYLLP